MRFVDDYIIFNMIVNFNMKKKNKEFTDITSNKATIEFYKT